MVISIIIPVYNQKKFLSRCLTSLQNQKFRDWEAILIDDGSTDGSGSLCDAWSEKDQRIRVIHQENAGASAARNRGIQEGKGDYICCVDSDDYVSDSFLEELARLIEQKSPDVIMVNARKLVKDGSCKPFSWIYDDRDDSLRLKKIALGGYAGETWRKIWRRNLISGPLFPPHIRSMEDLYATADLMEHAHRIGVLPNAYYILNRTPHASLLSTSKAMDKSYNKWMAWHHFEEVGQKARWSAIHPSIPKFHHLQRRIFGLKTWKQVQMEENRPDYIETLISFLQEEHLPQEGLEKMNACLAKDALHAIAYTLDFIGELPSAWISRHFKTLVKVYAMNSAAHFLNDREQDLLKETVHQLINQKESHHLVLAHRVQGLMIEHSLSYPFKNKGKKWIRCADDFICSC